MKLHFTNQLQYDFAVQFLNQLQRCAFKVQLEPAQRSAEVENPIVADLLARVDTSDLSCPQGATVLLYSTPKRDYWMIVGKSQRDLSQTLSRVSKFVIPSYAEFSGGFPQLQRFEPSKNRLHQLGSQLYPNGYYKWQSPVEYRQTILERLKLWLVLCAKQWPLPSKEKYSYRDLYALFESALAGANWPEAEEVLRQMRQLHLSTAENLKFLRIQLWAQQQQWQTIWQDDDFELLVRLRKIPRGVRAAMLTAFHHTQLLALEQEKAWEKARAVFRESRGRLGTLLTARLGITQAPVVRVFAYQALFEGDRIGVSQLLALDVDSETAHCLEALENLLPPLPPPPEPAISPLEQAHNALHQHAYDVAIRFANQIERPQEKTLLLIEVAFHSHDLNTATKALSLYDSLSAAEQSALHQKQWRVDRYLESLKQTTASATINPWLKWFEEVEADANESQLSAAAERLERQTDEWSWSAEDVERLYEKLLNLVTDEPLMARPYAKRVLQHLTAHFINDNQFPREDESYNDLYDLLLETLLAEKKVNETNSGMVLRLTEAILRHSPDKCDDFRQALQTWFEKPIPALENHVLEAFELLAEYGLEGWQLGNWYRTWLLHLLNLPTARSRVALEVWLDFGKWNQTGEKLLNKLERQLAALLEQESQTPIATLPAGYRIGIFTLRASSAERAKQLLLKRNPELDIRISLEKAMNSQVKSIAQNSDMAVVVTTCISHAITYGITPYLQNDPVYPASSGSTSIIRAIEEASMGN